VLIGWGALLGIATAAQTPFGPRIVEYALLGGASAACLASGLAMLAYDTLRFHMRERPRVLADNSFATATLVVGLAVALVGAGFGLWLILMGAGVAALGAGGLVREALARRRSAEPLRLEVTPPRPVPAARRAPVERTR
jgi:hypothetical protein